MNVIRGNDSFERRLNHLFRSRRDNVEGECITVQISQKLRKQRDVLLQPDLLANCGKIFFANPPKFRVVQQQVREFPSLLHEMDVRETVYSLLETIHTQ